MQMRTLMAAAAASLLFSIITGGMAFAQQSGAVDRPSSVGLLEPPARTTTRADLQHASPPLGPGPWIFDTAQQRIRVSVVTAMRRAGK